MPNIVSLRKAALAAVPVASSIEYDGANLQLTDETGTRYAVPKSGAAGAIAAVVVPASTVALVNTTDTNQMYCTTGGTVTAIDVKRGTNTAIAYADAAGAAVLACNVVIAPGDSIIWTYTVVPTVSVVPL